MSITKVKNKDGSTGYEVRWREPHPEIPGKRVRKSKTLDKRRDAERLDLEIRRKKQLGDLYTTTPSGILLNELLDDWLADQEGDKRPSTIEQRRDLCRRRIRPLLGAEAIRDIRRPRLIEWRNQLRATGASGGEQNAARRVLSAALTYACDRGLIDSNPCLGWKPVNQSRPDRTALPALWVEAIRAEMLTDQDKALVSVLAWAGLRTEEALGLRWGDVYPNHLRIRRAVWRGIVGPTKTRQERVVPLRDPVADDLERIRPADPHPDAYVFSKQPPKPVNLKNWTRRVWAPARERARLPRRAVPYELRHTHISHLVYGGALPQEIHRQVGHSSWTTTTGVYVHEVEGQRLEGERSMLDTIIEARQQAAPEHAQRQAQLASTPLDKLAKAVEKARG